MSDGIGRPIYHLGAGHQAPSHHAMMLPSAALPTITTTSSTMIIARSPGNVCVKAEPQAYLSSMAPRGPPPSSWRTGAQGIAATSQRCSDCPSVVTPPSLIDEREQS